MDQLLRRHFLRYVLLRRFRNTASFYYLNIAQRVISGMDFLQNDPTLIPTPQIFLLIHVVLGRRVLAVGGGGTIFLFYVAANLISFLQSTAAFMIFFTRFVRSFYLTFILIATGAPPNPTKTKFFKKSS
jgi:hypothetical protein